MSKKIEFDFDGKHYTLEFTRASVTAMQRQGFDIDLVPKFIALHLPTLFAGAFMANHKYIKPDLVDKIYDQISGKVDMVTSLVEMYREPLNALLEDPEESSGNVVWEKNWTEKV